MKYPITGLLLIFSFSLKAQVARGPGWCGAIFKSVEVGCADLVRSNGIGGSYPLLFDAFNVNSGALPTYPTPVGIETFFDESKFNYSFIKGVKNFGTGLTYSTTQGTFFSPVSNVEVAQIQNARSQDSSSASLNNAESVGDYRPNIHYGHSIHLFGAPKSLLQTSLGVSGRFNLEERAWDYETGLIFKTRGFNAGISGTWRENKEFITTVTTGFKAFNVAFEWTYIANKNRNTGDLVVTTISSFNFAFWGMHATLAFRKQNNPTLNQISIDELEQTQNIDYRTRHTLIGLQYKFLDERFTVGFYSNYILGKGSSFLFQYIWGSG